MSTRSTSRWSKYHRLTAQRPSRELLRATLRLLGTTPSGRVAVGLGCGAGVESLELLRQGWSVLAVDPSRSAIEQLRSAVPKEHADRLKTRVARAESLRLPSADLVWAGLSLPFVSPRSFTRLWRAIVASLMPGGVFVGDFFGPRLGVLLRDELPFLAGSTGALPPTHHRIVRLGARPPRHGDERHLARPRCHRSQAPFFSPREGHTVHSSDAQPPVAADERTVPICGLTARW